LPSKERKLKTIQPDNCEPFEKTVAAVIAKLRENKDERVRSKNYKQFKTSKAWNDRLLELSVYLEIPKDYFGYSTKTRGVLWGPMTVHLDGMTCNCLFPNTSIPQEFETLTLTNKIDFILIVEKECFFDSIVGLYKKEKNCLILTGMGLPDFTTRRFAKQLGTQFPDIPMLCITDCNPRGYHIYTIYRYGCKTGVHSGEDLALPRLQRIGVSPRDYRNIKKFLQESSNEDEKTFEPLNDDDRQTLWMLKKYKCYQGIEEKEFQDDFDLFAFKNEKCDMEILGDSLEAYLQRKLRRFVNEK
jgi:DNA topoisomerase VI subunit A